MTRVKDNKFVACALDSVLGPALEKARAEGLDITTVILKVCQKLFSISLTTYYLFFRKASLRARPVVALRCLIS